MLCQYCNTDHTSYITVLPTIEYVSLYNTTPPHATSSSYPSDRRCSVVVWWCALWTGVESGISSLYHHSLSSLTVYSYPYLSLYYSFSAPNPRPTNNNTNNSSISRSETYNFPPYFSTSFLHHKLPSTTSFFSGPTGPSAPLHRLFATANPLQILAFHQTTFASKIRALETPALTTSLQSLTKPLFVSGYSVPAQLPTPNDQGYLTIPATTYGQQTSQITTSFNILGNLMISS
ncbi:hypothetical protein O988_07966 [Pseudogymnoascus sp. VKM F-3808]|nr:hypothetical protein O988_07966 [Pseudogymnoascus sp. VKM F-3808]